MYILDWGETTSLLPYCAKSLWLAANPCAVSLPELSMEPEPDAIHFANLYKSYKIITPFPRLA